MPESVVRSNVLNRLVLRKNMFEHCSQKFGKNQPAYKQESETRLGRHGGMSPFFPAQTAVQEHRVPVQSVARTSLGYIFGRDLKIKSLFNLSTNDRRARPLLSSPGRFLYNISIKGLLEKKCNVSMKFTGKNAYEKFRGRPLDPAWQNLFIHGIYWQDLWHMFAQGLHKRRLVKMFRQNFYKSFLGKKKCKNCLQRFQQISYAMSACDPSKRCLKKSLLPSSGRCTTSLSRVLWQNFRSIILQKLCRQDF